MSSDVSGNKVEDLIAIFNLWFEEKDRIADLFRKRDKQAVTIPILKHVENFVKAVYIMNGFFDLAAESWQDNIDSLAIKPINVKERLTFIFDSPSHYHSYIQLSSLFEEFRKQFEKEMVLMQFRDEKTR
ncbi:YpoC family protein [Calidifontibacillus oryziterrae]|uniref:YpoC family protein n=1 Tax=Calidifontibacillus oryziterrae TaxID=1191699 RepID=UPI0002FAC6CF|nr:hypothetical protein [Calidifontibacillus oryziterrae]